MNKIIVVFAFVLVLSISPVFASPCHITIYKLVVGDVDGDFPISLNEETNIYGNGTSMTFHLNPGNYTVKELVPEGWILSDIDIVDPSGDSYSNGDTAYIVLGDEGVDVTFINRRVEVVGGTIISNTRDLLTQLSLLLIAIPLTIYGIRRRLKH